ncbi:MAG: prenyltransferase [Planctomycetes bacterium]|nr:prenyltransferase [Planctomycetota bacterium]
MRAFWKTWWIAVRPFSFPASTMSVVFGTALGATVGGARLNVPLFLASFAGMMLLHAGANALNDAVDFRKGIDREVVPGSGAVVRGLLSPEAAIRGAIVLLAAGGALGIAVACFVGWPIVIIGAAGILIGILYSATPLGLKYRALGDLAVFLDFGILGSLGAWTVQTGSVSWIPAVWAIPLSLLVVGILHANNWRDIAGDEARRAKTIASILRDRGSLVYYGILVFAPFALILGFVVVPRVTGLGPAMPVWCVLTLAALPLAARLFGRAIRRRDPRRPLDFVALDAATAQLALAFGVLSTAALILDALAGRGA